MVSIWLSINILQQFKGSYYFLLTVLTFSESTLPFEYSLTTYNAICRLHLKTCKEHIEACGKLFRIGAKDGAVKNICTVLSLYIKIKSYEAISYV